jgi:Fe-S-cluster containining protein
MKAPSLPLRARASLFHVEPNDVKTIRIGECRMCGTCCKDLGLYMDGRKIGRELLDKIMKTNPHLRFKGTVDGWDKWYCTAQGPDNKCTMHGSRPEMCMLYPRTASDIRGDFCGYRFLTGLEAVDLVFRELLGLGGK